MNADYPSKWVIIARRFTVQPVANRNVNPGIETMVGNGKAIATGGLGEISGYLQDLQSIEISVNANGATFTIGKYAPVTAPLADPAGNWRKPKTLRIRFEHNGKKGPVYTAAIDLHALKYYSK